MFGVRSGPPAAEESLSHAWNAWIRRDSTYSGHPLVSSSSFWSSAHGEVLSPHGRSGPLRQGVTTAAFQGPTAVHLSADLDDAFSPVRSTKAAGFSIHQSRRALPIRDSEHALETRESAASMSRHDMQNFDARLHAAGLQRPENTQQTRSLYSQRSSGDHPPGAMPALEPLTGEDTLPSSFHVESVYSHALMRDDTISTWAPGSQQDTARSRRPDPASVQTTAPSSQASDRLPTQAGHQGASRASQFQDAAPRPSVSYMRPTPVQHDAAPQQTWHASPGAIAETKDSSSASTVSSSSHFQLAARYGGKRKPAPPKQQPGSSHSYELPSSSAAKHESSLAIHSAMTGVILLQQHLSTKSPA